MEIIRTIKTSRWVVVLAILAILAIAADILITRVLNLGEGDAFNAADYQTGSQTGQGTLDQDIIIAKVGKGTVSLAEFKEKMLHQRYARSVMKQQLDGPDTGMPTGVLEAYYQLTTKWGPENAALGDLILNLALLQEALALGLSATDQEIAESIEFDRAAFDNGDFVPYNWGYVTGLGEDTHWNVVYPARVRASLAIDKLRQHVIATCQQNDCRNLWPEHNEATIDKTDIELFGSEHHSATLEGVLGFLAESRELKQRNLPTR